MYYIVYKTTNLLNNKEYIGIHQTKNLNDGYLGSGKHLKYAVTKYGVENFGRQILFYCETHEEMLAKEAELVTEEWCSWSNTYNICVGGFGGGFKYLNDGSEDHIERSKRGYEASLKGFEHSFEVRSARSRKAVETRRAAGSLARGLPDWTGKKHSLESKMKMRGKTHQCGSTNSQFGTFWITNGSENRKLKSLDLIPEGWYRGRTVAGMV